MAPTAALAQTSAVDQYAPNPPNPPVGGQNPDEGGGNQPPGGGNPPGGGGQNPADDGGGNPLATDDVAGPAFSPSVGTGQSDAGSLPFTGYPLTGLLLIVLLLLVGGLLLRFGPQGIARLRGAYGTTR
jgi:hypothetical protein